MDPNGWHGMEGEPFQKIFQETHMYPIIIIRNWHPFDTYYYE